jgi:Histidine-specific methyltransferase, SAM-dependent
VQESAPLKSRERLRIKAVLADFNRLDSIRDAFAHRDSPNVVGLLGSLGNLEHELRFLRRLRRQMSNDDLLVLEVRLKSKDEQITELTDGDAALRFDFGALEGYLGLAFDKELMTIQRESDVSSIKETVTTVVGCENLEYRGMCYPRVKLMYIHQYVEDAFVDAVTKAGFSLVTSERGGRDESFLVCVLKRS